MIAYKVVNKRSRGLFTDYLMFPVKHKFNKYSIRYSTGKTIIAKKGTLGIFLCKTLKTAKTWAMGWGKYYNPKILKVEILDNPSYPDSMCGEASPAKLDSFYQGSYKTSLIPIPHNVLCSHKIKVLEEVKNNE